VLKTDGYDVTGKVAFDGHPVSGSSPTPGGHVLQIFVTVECLGCPGHLNTWLIVGGVQPNPNGTFDVFVGKPSDIGREYRATVQGPNVGGWLAPDARTMIAAKAT
jgi:hypothetical protein